MRLIDADELIGKLRRMPVFEKKNSVKHMMYVEKSCIDAMPTVDAVEVVHGRWEKQLGIDHCSVCHKVRPYDVQADVVQYWQCDYCPNCGADMRERSTNEQE